MAQEREKLQLTKKEAQAIVWEEQANMKQFQMKLLILEDGQLTIAS